MNELIKRIAPTTAFLVLFAQGATAQDLANYDYENLRFRGIGLEYGRIWPNKVEATETYGLRLDLGFLGPSVRVAPVFNYWRSTLKRSQLERFANQLNNLPALQQRGVVIDPDELGPIRWSDLSVSVDTHVMWTLQPVGLFTYAGGGLGLHLMNGKGAAVEGTFVEDLLDSTAGSIAVMAGLEYQPLAQLRLYADARYTLMSDIRYPGLRIGAAFMLPQDGTTGAPGNGRE